MTCSSTLRFCHLYRIFLKKKGMLTFDVCVMVKSSGGLELR